MRTKVKKSIKYLKSKVFKHLEEDIKKSEKSIKEDKELEKTLGRMI